MKSRSWPSAKWATKNNPIPSHYIYKLVENGFPIQWVQLSPITQVVYLPKKWPTIATFDGKNVEKISGSIPLGSSGWSHHQIPIRSAMVRPLLWPLILLMINTFSGACVRAKRRVAGWVGLLGVAGIMKLIVSQWIIPENSLRKMHQSEQFVLFEKAHWITMIFFLQRKLS